MDLLNFIYKKLEKTRVYRYPSRVPSKIKLIVLLRIRNEELIIRDTLEHLSSIADAIICYDDASTDKTFEIVSKHPKTIAVIRNFNWATKIEERLESETNHRKLLHELALEYNPEWILCADADERYIGDIRTYLETEEASSLDYIRIRLFDAYITPEDNEPYSGGPLAYFRKYFGPECRNIIMLWRASNQNIFYKGSDSREPVVPESAVGMVHFYCQHYGKSLSIQHWEETCNYYSQYFPKETYGQKWEARKGKAVHTLSDFDRPLYPWGQELFMNSVIIHGYMDRSGDQK
ncbi:glycosyltransferase family 2 protein [Paenibacillus sp.]|uniref:glycosyltransferase family 2 protein n=1 Tax=Paenibacillus sp. TaxID=58172 RepID=UPI0028128B29|nr:glycosyltransferase family 2 protein [Paenibacillus sp.]